MRDLNTETQGGHNGLPHTTGADLGIEDRPEPRLAVLRRDKKLAEVAVMLLDAAKMLDPIVEIVSGKLLRWVALGASVGLAFYALRDPSYERGAILAVFMILVRVMLGKG